MRDVQQNLYELQAAVDRLTRQSHGDQLPNTAPALRAVYQELLAQEMEPTLALELVGQLEEELGQNPNVGALQVRQRLAQLLVSRLPVAALEGRNRRSRRGKRQRVIALVGPTGVGKTTTLAKLASRLAFDGSERVSLITTDTFRIAAAAQLGTYADIMSLPLEVVYGVEELPRAIAKQADADYVLIDTPGCSQRNEPQLRELAGFVAAAQAAARDTTVLLTVAAPAKLRDMLDIRQRFSLLPLHGLVLTKTDETSVYGPLASLAIRAGKPVYYVTTGQNVPNDIEPATSTGLARMLLGELPDHPSVDNGMAEAEAPASVGGRA